MRVCGVLAHARCGFMGVATCRTELTFASCGSIGVTGMVGAAGDGKAAVCNHSVVVGKANEIDAVAAAAAAHHSVEHSCQSEVHRAA